MPIKVTMPQLSPTMTEGTLAKWLVAEGDEVRPGAVLAEIETDKATMEVEAVDEGRVGRILVPEGRDNVPVNEVIALLFEEGEEAAALEPGDAAPEAASETTPETTVAAPEPASRDDEPRRSPPPAAPGEPASSSAGGRAKASPLARAMARQAGLDLERIAGSGPHGRIVRRDIEERLRSSRAAAPSVAAAPEPEPAAFDEIEVSAMRRVIAERLQLAKSTIPHFYLGLDCNIDRLLALRAELNAHLPDGKLTLNDFVIKAAALALRAVPEANAQWAETVIRRFRAVDIAVAVAVEDGLVTPVIRRADAKSLVDLSSEMKALAARARAGGLKPEEYRGGGFTVSNLGMYGIRTVDAVINPPQAGILAIGAGERRAVVEDGEVAVATVMSVTLSCDHRVIDGAVGARLLTAFRDRIEDPLAMLL